MHPGNPMYLPSGKKCSTHFWNQLHTLLLGGTAMIIRLIVLIGIRNLAIITSRCKTLQQVLGKHTKRKESTILTLRCKPIITSVTSYSFAVWIMPEAIFKSYRVICRKGTSAEAVIIAAFSKYLLPRSSKPSESIIVIDHIQCQQVIFLFGIAYQQNKFIRYSIVSGFAIGIKVSFPPQPYVLLPNALHTWLSYEPPFQ